MGADYLLYALLDTIVDNYFVVLELLGDRLETFEDSALVEDDGNLLHELQELKRELAKTEARDMAGS